MELVIVETAFILKVKEPFLKDRMEAKIVVILISTAELTYWKLTMKTHKTTTIII